MLQEFHGIVLSVFKYNDKSNIVHIFSREEGRGSFLVPAVRLRRSTVRQVLFQPLHMVEFVADVKPRSSLHPVREARAMVTYSSIPYDPYKSAIALFLSEFLSRSLYEEAGNQPLFAYLCNSMQWLDGCQGTFANFHLVFLMRFSRFLGLYPNIEGYTAGNFFDMQNACFVSERPLHGMFLSAEESARINVLMRMNYDTMHLFAMSRAERNRCVDVMMEYYRLHLPDFPEMKSLPVLKELF